MPGVSGRGPSGSPWPTASTRLVALLGWPARHSLSPVIHNAAFAEQRLDLVYVALPTPPGELDQAIRLLATWEAVGANVTVPHKEQALGRCDVVTPEAELIGAVNTLAWGADGLVGDNTDAIGLGEVLRHDVPIVPGDVCLVLGTGGAARATVVALGRVGAEVIVVGRRVGAADALAELAGLAGAADARGVDLGDEGAVGRSVTSARLVVNATPLGMAGEELPAPFMGLGAGQIAYDLVYAPPETPFLRAARARGAEPHHGLSMLVAQAAASYRRWTGHEAPLATMSAAAVGALAQRHR